ncbi:MAG TPA: TetR/AcrR family transcriptional regulator [Xanthobacteraceae bacterium]|nr:TetR/AcrR family transcriptional regulator [Xanthobacteraceae bacterium]
MARRPARKSAAKRAPADRHVAASLPPDMSDRDKIIAAFLNLLAEKRFEQIGLAEIADAADVSLAEFRDEFASTPAILAAYIKDTDRAVLAADFSDMEDEPPRERLFDVLMRRLEILSPHREAIRSLIRSASRNAPLAMTLNGLAVRSQQWMLTAAGIGAAGPRGMLRAQGLSLLFGSVLQTWVNDEDPGLARTMAALDRALSRGQRFAGLFEDLFGLPARLCRLRPRRRRAADGDSDDPEEVAAA